jgi:hypothetical protein
LEERRKRIESGPVDPAAGMAVTVEIEIGQRRTI